MKGIAKQAYRLLSMYLLVVIGMAFALYSMYVFTQTGDLYYWISGMLSGMLVYTQADRNVYYKRLNNLSRVLRESDVSLGIERVNYTDYEINQGTTNNE